LWVLWWPIVVLPRVLRHAAPLKRHGLVRHGLKRAEVPLGQAFVHHLRLDLARAFVHLHYVLGRAIIDLEVLGRLFDG
jgi:hypothetical protein